jgi:hypothetical protein
LLHLRFQVFSTPIRFRQFSALMRYSAAHGRPTYNGNSICCVIGTGGPAFESLAQNIKVGAPFFAVFAKDGHDAACSADFNSIENLPHKQHRARPCQKRKDGAPTVVVVPRKSKAGPLGDFREAKIARRRR